MNELIKHCPFCGSSVRIRIGVGGLHFFYCTNGDECGAIVSFHGGKHDGKQRDEAEDPIQNWNNRARCHGEYIGKNMLLQ